MVFKWKYLNLYHQLFMAVVLCIYVWMRSKILWIREYELHTHVKSKPFWVKHVTLESIIKCNKIISFTLYVTSPFEDLRTGMSSSEACMISENWNFQIGVVKKWGWMKIWSAEKFTHWAVKVFRIHLTWSYFWGCPLIFM